MADPHITPTARIESHVLKAYLRKRIEPVFRSDMFMAGLKAHGRITYKNGGKSLNWRPRFRRRTITAGDATPASISFPSTNTRKVADLPWRKYDMGESYTKFEQLVSQGDASLFDIVQELMNELADDFMEDLRLKLYSNGYATGSKDIMGLESAFRNSGAVISANTFCAAANNTYATLNSTLGQYGGTWTSGAGAAWPMGTGDAEYCWWTPMIIDTTNATSLFSGTGTWKANWQYCLNAMMTYQEALQRNKVDFLLLHTELLRTAKDSLTTNQRFEITQNSKITTETGVKTLSFEGLELQTEYGVPANVGYGLRWDKLELKSMQGQLIDTANDQDITTSEHLVALDSYLQLMIDSPAYLTKLMAIS